MGDKCLNSSRGLVPRSSPYGSASGVERCHELLAVLPVKFASSLVVFGACAQKRRRNQGETNNTIRIAIASPAVGAPDPLCDLWVLCTPVSSLSLLVVAPRHVPSSETARSLWIKGWPCHTPNVDHSRRFASHAFSCGFAASHPCDTVHVSKSRTANFTVQTLPGERNAARLAAAHKTHNCATDGGAKW